MIKNLYRCSELYACHSKKYLAHLLSNYKINNIIETKHLRNVDFHFCNKLKVFYQSKVTGEQFSERPKNYSPKKYRQFTDADRSRKLALKKLNKILYQVELPSYLYSKKESDYVKNAFNHKGSTKFILMDIQSYFPSCRVNYIKDFFVKESGLNMSPDIAESMTKFVTVYDSVLKQRIIPQGFPTSPIIAYYAYKEMFDEINEECTKRNIKFTVYVDDLTFSYTDEIEIDANEFVEIIIKIVKKYKHNVKKRKTKILNISDNKVPLITGVLVKRYKVRASKYMHIKMIRLYRKLINLRIDTKDDYFIAWKLFSKFNGLIASINYIEPKYKMNKGKIYNEYIKKYKNKFILNVSITKVNKLKLDGDLYNAYKNNSLKAFYKANYSRLNCK